MDSGWYFFSLERVLYKDIDLILKTKFTDYYQYIKVIISHGIQTHDDNIRYCNKMYSAIEYSTRYHVCSS